MREKSQRRQTAEEKSPDSENFHGRIAPIDPIADDEFAMIRVAGMMQASSGGPEFVARNKIENLRKTIAQVRKRRRLEAERF